ncbi:Glycosyl transferase family 2 [Arthrobacter saudimassiliensis]|uniref:Glycosyl transferase family 2 n=1 Tax=Arthrobacter saudimassiliensis TaxID=1461584 RepID=A0A078MRJ7_9MICC|nr:Glycosyl transferase family 2 [Arthrobacter saudimassiliensis]
MVAHNGAQYLPRTLDALAGQSRPVDFCIGVDTGSDDASASLLQLGLPVGSPVIAAPERSRFGHAVSAGLAELPAAFSDGAEQEWIWLLHDDSAPDARALEELLLAVERAPSVAVAGGKLVDRDNPRRLAEAGLSVSRWAERLTLIDADELDQGQYDARSDTFAVNSAGMLVRRDVWTALGGFDPALPGPGDDIDLCWRARLAGHRVIVVPQARIRHAGSRTPAAQAAWAARRAEIHLRLKHAPGWQVPFLAVGAVLGGLWRFLLGMVAKQPGYAVRSLGASVAGVLHPLELARSRRAAAATRTRPRSAVNALVTGPREVREHRRSLFESRAGAGPAEAGAVDPSAHEPTGDLHDDFTDLAAPSRTWVGLGALTAALVLLGGSLLALRGLLGAPAAAGGALLPVSERLGEIWAHASGWWSAVGAGVPGHGDPFDYLLWLLGLVGAGNANAAVLVLLLTALPLSGVAAWFAAGAFTHRRGLRFWAAMAWGSAPALHLAVGEGRLGAVIAHLAIPLAVLATARAVGAGGTEAPAAAGPDEAPARQRPGTGGIPSWTAAAAAGLAFAVLAACAPSTVPVMVLAVIALMLGLRRRARTLWWALLPPAAVLLPNVLASLSGNPRALAADPGLPLGFAAAEPWQQLLGYPIRFDIFDPLSEALPETVPWALAAALIIGAPTVALAVLGLFLGPRPGLARLCWLLALASLGTAAAAGHLATGASAAGIVAPFPGPLVGIAGFCLLAAGLPAAQALLGGRRQGARRRTSPPRARRSAAVILTVLLGAGPALSLAAWTVPTLVDGLDAGPVLPGSRISVRESAPATLPMTAADRGTGPEHTHALVIGTDSAGTVTAALMRGSGTTLDSLSAAAASRAVVGSDPAGQLARDDAAAADIRRAVAIITEGNGTDPGAELHRLGAAFVVLQHSSTASELLASRIDAVPGLAAVGSTNAGWLWRVTGNLDEQGTEAESGQIGRVRVEAEDGTTEAVLESGLLDASGRLQPGGEGRRLVLSERSDPGWYALLDGRPLEDATDGWAQAFALPADGGQLEVGYRSPWQPWAEVVQAAVLALTLLLAVPVPARRTAPRLPGASAAAATVHAPQPAPDAGAAAPAPDTAAPGQAGMKEPQASRPDELAGVHGQTGRPGDDKARHEEEAH